MASLYPSIEDFVSTNGDPWDWSVGQVVAALCDPESAIRKSGDYPMPDINFLSGILLENDVNGLALLQQVDTQCLKTDFGLKSMSHRASICHFIELLRLDSLKYQEHEGRKESSHNQRSSVGWAARVSPYLRQQHEARDSYATPRQSSQGPYGRYSYRLPVFDGQSRSIEKPEERSRNVLSEGPLLPHILTPDSNPTNDYTRPAKDESPTKKTTISEDLTDIVPVVVKNADTTRVAPAAVAKWHEVTTFVDANGRKRKRLVTSTHHTTEPSVREAEEVSTSEIPAERHSDNVDSHVQALDRSPSRAACLDADPDVDDDLVDGNEHFEPPEIDDIHPPEHTEPILPGILHFDKQGRKRMQPQLVSVSDAIDQDQASLHLEKDHPKVVGEPHKFLEAESELALNSRIVTSGKKANRKSSQSYLGHEVLPVDEIFYGDTRLEQRLEGDASSRMDLENEGTWSFVGPDFPTGQKRYVATRMKYFLRSPIEPIPIDGPEKVGRIPYPDYIGRKHFPLSMTVFSSVSGRFQATRSNRSKWIKKMPTRDCSTKDAKPSSIFNIADPASAVDEGDDVEWKALEKWNYIDEQDEILPRYGDSGSEGEYDLATWREMEREIEKGKLGRPKSRSRKPKMTSEEVNLAIDTALEQMNADWKANRQPKLQHKAWRLWMKANRDRTRQSQSARCKDSIKSLDVRIQSLRAEILGEMWPKAKHVIKQCKIIEPSFFDREELKWKLAILQTSKAPEKLPSLGKKIRSIQGQKDISLQDGEELVSTDDDCTEDSNEDLDNFIVEDDDDPLPPEPEDDLTVIDGEDLAEPDTLLLKPGGEGPQAISQTSMRRSPPFIDGKAAFSEPLSLPSPVPHLKANEDEAVLHKQSPSQPQPDYVDLTQLPSDPVEPTSPLLKKERTYGPRTPPLLNSDEDSEWFKSARKTKRQFKMPSTPRHNPNIINLETETETEGPVPEENPEPTAPLLEPTDVERIDELDPKDLVEKGDGRGLLAWTIRRTPEKQRKRAASYLQKTSMEQISRHLADGLSSLCSHALRIRSLDEGTSASVLQVAAWRVCFTIPVILSSSGIRTIHVRKTQEDEHGFELFYDTLLECLSDHDYGEHEKSLSHPSSIKASKSKTKKAKIIREDPDNVDRMTPYKKRKYVVNESQATLEKRHAAQDRVREDEQRRRREELKARRLEVSDGEGDGLGLILNPGKLEAQEYIRLTPRFGNGAQLKPHQVEGIRFMWREITADPEDLQGCLIAQSMGLGKTMQVVALLVAIGEAAKSPDPGIRNQVPPALRDPRVLILLPPTLIENWMDEFLLWAPEPFQNHIGEVRKVQTSSLEERLDQIRKWDHRGGVLIMAYSIFKAMIENSATDKRPPRLDKNQHELVTKALLERTTMVVTDEAHHFKSRTSKIHHAIMRIQTKCRIALTGTPLSNNLGEYFSMIDWIAPRYLGTYTEFKATYEEPISEGLWHESTASEYRESRKLLKVLQWDMEPKVNRADVSVLHAALKGKFEFVISVPLTPIQEELYRIYVQSLLTAGSGGELKEALMWSWLNVLRILCNHPKLFKDKISELSAKAADPAQNTTGKRKEKKSVRQALEKEQQLLDSENAITEEPIARLALSRTIEGVKRVLNDAPYPLDSINLSNKIQVLMKIVELCEAAGDKVLVFSHSIPTLNYVEDQLKKTSRTCARIDGQTPTAKRQELTKSFNRGSVGTCIISTRAGGQGLNLTGANRVVILDESFNPMWERQAIGRAYRIGQTKPVYIYRLTVAGTFEQALYNQSLFKEQLATRVVDKKNPFRNARKGAKQYLFLPKTIDQDDLSDFSDKDPEVLDHLLSDIDKNQVLSIIASETFPPEDNVELDAQGKKEAEQIQKDQQLRRRDPFAYQMMMDKRNAQEKAVKTHASLVKSVGPGVDFHGGPSALPQQATSNVLTNANFAAVAATVMAPAFRYNGLPIPSTAPPVLSRISSHSPKPPSTDLTIGKVTRPGENKDSLPPKSLAFYPERTQSELRAFRQENDATTAGKIDSRASPDGSRRKVSSDGDASESMFTFQELNAALINGHEQRLSDSAASPTSNTNPRKHKLHETTDRPSKKLKPIMGPDYVDVNGHKVSAGFKSSGPMETDLNNILDREMTR